MDSQTIPADLETVWSVNEAFRAIQDARAQGLEPSPDVQRFFVTNIGCFVAAQEVIIDKLTEELDGSDGDMLRIAAYDALAESERGEDSDTIVLRALYKLDDINSLTSEDTANSSSQTLKDKSVDTDAVEPKPQLPMEVFEQAKTGDTRAQMEIVNRYKRLILKLANQAASKLPARASAIDVDDLIQEGTIALLDAVNHYDGRASFMSYAYKYVWGKIRGHVEDMMSTVRVPRDMRQKIAKVNTVNWSRRASQRPLLTPEEIGDLVDLHPSPRPTFYRGVRTVGDLWVTELLTTYMGSIDNGYAPRNDISPGNGYVLDEMHGLENVTTQAAESVEEQAAMADLPDLVEEALKELSKRERTVLAMRFVLRKTLDDIGLDLGLDRESVRRIEAGAMARLRHTSRSNTLRGIVS